MEKSIEKNHPSNVRKQSDFQKPSRCPVKLEPNERKTEDSGSSRIMRVVNKAADNLKLAVLVAEICNEGMVKELNLDSCSFCTIST